MNISTSSIQRNTRKIITSCFIGLFIFASVSVNGQSKAIEAFAEEANGYKLFLYQSLIRVLNQDKNEDFNKLIADLDHLKFLMTDSLGDQSQQLYKDLEKGLNEEGFEELMNFDNKDYKATVYSLESSKNSTNWVVIFTVDDMSGLFEMKGSINMKYMNALSSLDMNKLHEFFPTLEEFHEDPDNKYKHDSEEEYNDFIHKPEADDE